MADEYLKCIRHIRDKVSNEYMDMETVELKQITTKYSNTKVPIFKLVISEKAISRNNNYLVGYTCQTCNSQQEISLNLYMRKVNKHGKCCVVCVNKQPEKASAQSLFMEAHVKCVMSGKYEKVVKKVKSTPLPEYLKLSDEEWMKQEEEFRSTYKLCHLTIDEFECIRHLIQDVNKGKVKNLTGWSYFPHYRVWNQTKFTPMLIHMESNTIEKPYYIKFACENCGEHFEHRDLEVIKNKKKIYCRECSFTNKTFRIRNMTLKDGTKILWQSVQERRFIEWCEDHNVQIKNGPKIPYEFNGATKEYRVDFELPKLKQLIEIKDNHCWYRQQVASGKQSQKENAAKKWCLDMNYEYNILFPQNIQNFKNKYLESCKI
jgi:hypothetical protein